MIPFAIFMANFIWDDGSSLSVSALEPRSDGFTFRVSKDESGYFIKGPVLCEGFFLEPETKKYKKLHCDDFGDTGDVSFLSSF